ncbi:hypothetical protein VPH35_132918 [Triticum aestivum]|uniref:DUF4220 domain-containing protein n=1 Tax=Triticum aestivum TaxID=4565 RepID=A0A3B6SKW9_WHEAT|nr:uncharacterized protein LOC123162044 [Triticum aestivum]
MGETGAPMQYLLYLWNEWELQTVVAASFSLQVILFFFAGVRRYNTSSVVRVILWLVYLLADAIAIYALGHITSSLSKKSNQLVAFWAPLLVLHLGGQDTITAYALEDNELWLRHLLNMSVQVAGTAYVLYKYIKEDGSTFARAAIWVLAAGVFKYGERIRALKLATRKHSKKNWKPRRIWRRRTTDPPLESVPFEIYAFIVMRAHVVRHNYVKPIIMGYPAGNTTNEIGASLMDDFWEQVRDHVTYVQGYAPRLREEDASLEEKMQTKNLYKTIEVELGLVYETLYTKAPVIHTWYGHCIRTFSLVSCFAALVIFTVSKKDSYSTPNVVITFALLGGACALEVASVFKASGSTWTYAILRDEGYNRLANAILFARYHLRLVNDGRWSDSIGQSNFISYYAFDPKEDLAGRISRWIGLRRLWFKAHRIKHAKLSPAVKEFVYALLKGEWRHLVSIEDVGPRRAAWARKFSDNAKIKQLDWSLSFEFQECVYIWHIATSTFLNNSALEPELVNKDMAVMAGAVNTLSDYMMYLLVKHPDILPTEEASRRWYDSVGRVYVYILGRGGDECGPHAVMLKCDAKERDWDSNGDWAMMEKAGTLARIMLDMELGLPHKLVILGTVWMEMLCHTATNTAGEFHARQLSNGGEFLTHILLLAGYCSYMKEATKPPEADDCKDVIIEIP